MAPIKKITRKLKRTLLEIRWLIIKYNPIGNNINRTGQVVIIASAHKVGSTWLYDLVKTAFHFRTAYVPKELDDSGTNTLKLDHSNIEKFLSTLHGRYIIKSHSFPTSPEKRGGAKIITIVRDPRDVIVSSAFYLANIPEEKGGWGKTYSLMGNKEKIKEVIKKGEFIIDRLEAWHRSQETLIIKYEDLLVNTEKQLESVKHFLEIDNCPDLDIRNAILANSFSAKAKGRTQGVEDRKSFYRKGIAGDWKNYFTDEIIILFKQALEGRWNNLLLELGYEIDGDWSNDSR